MIQFEEKLGFLEVPINLTRELFLYPEIGSWDGTAYSGRLANDAHTSGLPYVSINAENGTFDLIGAPSANTYTGTFTRVE
ncbi:hypothetical protein HZZ02_03610 [Streptococcus danieliae]|nr:hypothetical protein [Streptococcus danieliae]